MSRPFGPLALLLTLALAAAPVGAEIYKWVDRQGKTQYSDAPPPAAATPVEVLKTPSAPAAPPAATDWSAKEREFRQRQNARQEAEKPAPNAPDPCAEAQKKLAAWRFMEGRRAYRTNQAGERVYISDEERDADKAAAEKAVQTHCR